MNWNETTEAVDLLEAIMAGNSPIRPDGRRPSADLNEEVGVWEQQMVPSYMPECWQIVGPEIVERRSHDATPYHPDAGVLGSGGTSTSTRRFHYLYCVEPGAEK